MVDEQMLQGMTTGKFCDSGSRTTSLTTTLKNGFVEMSRFSTLLPAVAKTGRMRPAQILKEAVFLSIHHNVTHHRIRSAVC